jgi:small subunit ribosomal protein S20
LANTKSAQKQVRVVQRRRLRNKPLHGQAKTQVNKAEQLIFSGRLKQAEPGVLVAVSSLDEAASKGVIHPNNAARRKSRLMRKINKARAESTAK